MTTSQIKEHLIKTMSDEQLAKTVIAMQQMPHIFAANQKYIKLIIIEVCKRKDTKDPVLISLQDYIVNRIETLTLV